jgi:hypothetical protein
MCPRFISRARWVTFGLVLGLGVFVVGCAGGDGRAMTKVSGKVTLDGVPVDDGQILFRRTSGEQKGYEGLIKDGTYQLDCEQGDVKVEITAFRIVPGKFTTVNGPKEPVREMYVPEKYNTKTTLTQKLSGSSSTIPFELSSK